MHVYFRSLSKKKHLQLLLGENILLSLIYSKVVLMLKFEISKLIVKTLLQIRKRLLLVWTMSLDFNYKLKPLAVINLETVFSLSY